MYRLPVRPGIFQPENLQAGAVKGLNALTHDARCAHVECRAVTDTAAPSVRVTLCRH